MNRHTGGGEEDLPALAARLRSLVDRLVDLTDATAARSRAMEAALRPFAQASLLLSDAIPDEQPVILAEVLGSAVICTARDLRRARTLVGRNNAPGHDIAWDDPGR